MKTIPLTKGKFAIVDDADYEWLSKFKWRISSVGNYARRNESRSKHLHGKQNTVFMHRQIMQPPPGMTVDHANGNSLDNRRENLRVCSIQENLQNKTMSVTNTTGFKGVGIHKKSGRFFAHIKYFKRNIRIGYYDTAEEASAAYLAASKKLRGKFHSIR